MGGLKPTLLWLILSLTTLTFAHPDFELQSLHLNTIEKRELSTVGLQKRCVGSCVDCFGEGYQECASDSSVCFKAGDAFHGEETCSGSGTIDDTVPTVPAAPTVPTTDYCSKGDCATCFGAGYQQCPDSTLFCYKEGDENHGIDTCSSGSGSDDSTPSTGSDSSGPSTDSDASTPSGSNTTTTDFCDNGGFDCKLCFGGTYIPCPESSQYLSNKYCYDPNNSTSICPDGTSPAGGFGSSGSDSSVVSGSASYTASTPSATATTESPTETTSATSAGDTGSATGADDDSNSSPSTATISRTSSSVTRSSQTSATSTASGSSNDNPVSATTSGQTSPGEGMSGLLAVLALCFTASVGLII